MRSRWKGIYLHKILYKFIKLNHEEFGSSWLSQKINLRSSVFVTRLKRKNFFIHDGFMLIRLKIFTLRLKNIKIGQFTYNRKFPRHSIYDDIRRRTNRLIMLHKGVIRSKRRKKSSWKKFKLQE